MIDITPYNRIHVNHMDAWAPYGCMGTIRITAAQIDPCGPYESMCAIWV